MNSIILIELNDGTEFYVPYATLLETDGFWNNYDMIVGLTEVYPYNFDGNYKSLKKYWYIDYDDKLAKITESNLIKLLSVIGDNLDSIFIWSDFSSMKETFSDMDLKQNDLIEIEI